MTLQEIKQVKRGDCLTTKYGDILLVDRVEVSDERKVKVYFFFNWDADEKQLTKNEWLAEFYGTKFSDGFYRKSTDEERRLLFLKMAKIGYVWAEDYGRPIVTIDEFNRILKLLED